MATAIHLEGLRKDFPTPSGGRYTSVQNVTLNVEAGKFLCLVGPSGCGKSTILNMVAGLLEPTGGAISISGERLAGLNRRAGYMFQQDALLPWKTVLENVTLGLTFRGIARKEAEDRGRTWLARVGLEGFAASYPYQLSGGMRKRAAMVQSWIVNPDLLLMDEPFSSLDIHTRQKMEDELLQLWTDSHTTVLFVTHDLEEAIALSDRVLLFKAGPRAALKADYPVGLPRPRNVAEARFIPGFTELYRTVWSSLKEEVMAAYAR